MMKFDGKVLVVVDMEPGYTSNMTEKQVRTVEALIRAAVRADALIVFLEFMDQGTLRRLLKCVRGYDGFVRTSKPVADGSQEVIGACERSATDQNAFVICGVSTHCCVAQTAAALSWKVPQSTIQVVMEGCGDGNGNNWEAFPRANNIHLVSVPVAMAECA